MAQLYQQQLAELESMLDRKKAQLAAHQTELATVQKNFARLEDDFHYNLELLRQRDAELEGYDTKTSELLNELGAKEQEVRDLHSQVASLETKLQDELSRRVDESTYHQSKIDEVRKVLQTAQGEYEAELKRRQADMEAAVSGCQRSMREKEAAMEQRQRELGAFYEQKMEGVVKDKDRDRQQHLNTILTLENKQQESASRIASLTEELETTSVKRQKAEEQCHLLERALGDARATQQQLTEQLQSLQQKSNQMEQTLAEVRESHAAELIRLRDEHAVTLRGAAGDVHERIQQLCQDHAKQVRELTMAHQRQVQRLGEEAEERANSARDEAARKLLAVTSQLEQEKETIVQQLRTEVGSLRNQLQWKDKELCAAKEGYERELLTAREEARIKGIEAGDLAEKLGCLERRVIPALKQDMQLASIELQRVREQLESARRDADVRRQEILFLHQQAQQRLAHTLHTTVPRAEGNDRTHGAVADGPGGDKRAASLPPGSPTRAGRMQRDGAFPLLELSRPVCEAPPRLLAELEEAKDQIKQLRTQLAGATHPSSAAATTRVPPPPAGAAPGAADGRGHVPLFPGDMGPISPILSPGHMMSGGLTPAADERDNTTDALHTRLKDLEHQNDRLRAAIAAMRRDAEGPTVAEQPQQAEAPCVELTQACEGLRKKVHHLTQQISHLQDERVELMDLSNHLRRQLIRCQGQLHKYTTDSPQAQLNDLDYDLPRQSLDSEEPSPPLDEPQPSAPPPRAQSTGRSRNRDEGVYNAMRHVRSVAGGVTPPRVRQGELEIEGMGYGRHVL